MSDHSLRSVIKCLGSDKQPNISSKTLWISMLVFTPHFPCPQEREQRKSELEQELPPEPSPSNPDSIRILLKIPSGSRIERRFLRSQSLKVGRTEWLIEFQLCCLLALHQILDFTVNGETRLCQAHVLSESSLVIS